MAAEAVAPGTGPDPGSGSKFTALLATLGHRSPLATLSSSLIQPDGHSRLIKTQRSLALAFTAECWSAGDDAHPFAGVRTESTIQKLEFRSPSRPEPPRIHFGVVYCPVHPPSLSTLHAPRFRSPLSSLSPRFPLSAFLPPAPHPDGRRRFSTQWLPPRRHAPGPDDICCSSCRPFYSQRGVETCRHGHSLLKNDLRRMAVNSDKPNLWKGDIVRSVDLYNNWFMRFAPKTYRETRVQTTKQVEEALRKTDNLRDISPDVLRENPSVLPMLRMATAPPIARDRLIGLAGVSAGLVRSMELDKRVPQQMNPSELTGELKKIGAVILKLADKDILVWLGQNRKPKAQELHRAATVIADRLCGAEANPIIRNAQESRQLAKIREWLQKRGYAPSRAGLKMKEMKPGTFSIHLNVPVKLTTGTGITIPADMAISRPRAKPGELPLLIEAKSAGDYTNVNKRRKEEATKMSQLRATYGQGIRYVLFLCGYFDTGYLGYEAAEGIDWVWEHRIDDLAKLQL